MIFETILGVMVDAIGEARKDSKRKALLTTKPKNDLAFLKDAHLGTARVTRDEIVKIKEDISFLTKTLKEAESNSEAVDFARIYTNHCTSEQSYFEAITEHKFLDVYLFDMYCYASVIALADGNACDVEDLFMNELFGSYMHSSGFERLVKDSAGGKGGAVNVPKEAFSALLCGFLDPYGQKEIIDITNHLQEKIASNPYEGLNSIMGRYCSVSLVYGKMIAQADGELLMDEMYVVLNKAEGLANDAIHGSDLSLLSKL